MMTEKTNEILNQLVADLSALSALIHQTHWYMRGPEFLTLHPLMDDYMAEIDDQLDVVSERLIACGGSPYSTLAEWAAHTGVQSQAGDWKTPTPERFGRLVAAYRYLAGVYQRGIDVAGREDDDATQDIFIGYKRAIDKKIWMLQAQLGQAPQA